MQYESDSPVGGANTRRRHPYGREFLPLYDVTQTPGKTGQRWKLFDAVPPEEGGFTPGIVFPSQELLGMLQVGSLTNGSRVVFNHTAYIVENTFYLREQRKVGGHTIRREPGRLYRATGWPPELEEVTTK